MMRVWRLVLRRHAARALDGIGARTYGGRWNSRGTTVVYAADSRALAALEVLTGTRRTAVFRHYVLIGLTIPDEAVATVSTNALPADWRGISAPPATRRIGDAWVREASSVALRVPSALIPVEFNFLLNPVHPDFDEIEVDDPVDFDFDPWLG